jgi:hypothetical protein
MVIQMFIWLVVDLPLCKTFINGKDYLIIPYIMDNQKCLKPPTSHVLGSHKNHRSRVYKTHVEVTHRFYVDSIFRLG